jgi:ABC-type transport system involved in multi-copper enzyme maturation permease subunit
LAAARVVAIALNTWREAVRNKVVHSVAIFGVLFMASALALGELSLHEELRVTRDLGLGGLSLFGVAIAVFLGVTQVAREIDKKTIQLLLAKPVHRGEFLLGKFLGIATTLGLLVVALAVALAALLLLQGGTVDGGLACAFVLAYLEVLLIAAVAIFFSTFTTPLLGALFSVGLFAVGRSTEELRLVSVKLGRVGYQVVRGLLAVLPDLHLYVVSGALVEGQRVSVHEVYVSWGYVGSAAAYTALYIACTLVLASLIFRRRDFV